MQKPLLIAFLGFPGSGKTYFARQLAKKINAVTLNGDALRMAKFGSVERIEEARGRNPARVYSDVFRAMDYAARQILLAGHSVIYDAQQTKRRNRREIEALAEETNAVPVLVWIKTSRDVAVQRGQERQAGEYSHQYTAEKMAFLIDRFEKNVDLPGADENVIEINGEVSFDEQYSKFEAASQVLKGST